MSFFNNLQNTDWPNLTADPYSNLSPRIQILKGFIIKMMIQFHKNVYINIYIYHPITSSRVKNFRWMTLHHIHAAITCSLICHIPFPGPGGKGRSGRPRAPNELGPCMVLNPLVSHLERGLAGIIRRAKAEGLGLIWPSCSEEGERCSSLSD